MSRHLDVLRKARMDAELFTPLAAFEPRPVAAGRARPAVAPAAQFGDCRDQWQQLVHQLFLQGSPDARHSVGLASATAGEGTSHVVFHLAAELARSTSRPTLLLEANLYRPAQAERFAVEPDPGLRHRLRDGQVALEQCLHQTAIDHLWLLPAGLPSDGFAEAPDWTGFRRLFQSLRERFAAIVADLPPVNLSTDALIVAPLFDSLALVVQADLCSREVIQNTVARLRRANPNLAGAILNKRRFVIPTSLYRRL